VTHLGHAPEGTLFHSGHAEGLHDGFMPSWLFFFFFFFSRINGVRAQTRLEIFTYAV